MNRARCCSSSMHALCAIPGIDLKSTSSESNVCQLWPPSLAGPQRST